MSLGPEVFQHVAKGGGGGGGGEIAQFPASLSPLQPCKCL